jgi:multimeric flavodoxin WrbA
MKTLTIDASPRQGGNTFQLTEAYLDTLVSESQEIIHLRNMNIQHCTGCLACFKTGECIIDDDMNLIYKKLEEADHIIFSTPVYFNSVTSLAKTMIDRCQRNYARRFILKLDPKSVEGKKGILIMTAGSHERKGEFAGVRWPIDLFFKSNGITSFDEILIDDADRGNIDEKIKNCIQNIE